MATTKVTGNLINDLPSSVVATADLADGILSADATGRAKMADQFVTTAKLADGNVDHTKIAAGAVIQEVNTLVAAVDTTTTTTADVDTAPTTSHGKEFMSLSITPKRADSKLRIEVIAVVASSFAGVNVMTMALHQDATANALAAVQQGTPAQNVQCTIKLTYYMTSGTTSATTFKVRIGGSSAGTTTFNGASGARKMGGVMASSITITEIKA